MKIEEKRAEKKKYGMLNIYLFNYENCLRYIKSEKFMQSQFFGIQVMCKNILLVFISLFKLVEEKTLREKNFTKHFIPLSFIKAILVNYWIRREINADFLLFFPSIVKCNKKFSRG